MRPLPPRHCHSGPRTEPAKIFQRIALGIPKGEKKNNNNNNQFFKKTKIKYWKINVKKMKIMKL
jgi:hypothetical protein